MTHLLSYECFHCSQRNSSLIFIGGKEFETIIFGNNVCYCSDSKADCGLCSGALLNDHKAAQCDYCDQWIHKECSYMSETESETLVKTNAT